MRPGRELAHQRAALPAGQRPIRGLADEHVTEQPDLACSFQPGLLFIFCLRHQPLAPPPVPEWTDPSKLPGQDQQRERQLVLPDDQGQSGASRRPPDTADASSHGGTSPTPGHLDLTAALAPATAATASANAVTAAAGGTGSTPTPTSSTVNATRTASARSANRRSQPRTVSTGRPRAAATVRAPAPAAFAASAVPITVATSARRNSANTGSRTCDVPHERHRDRRGRTVTGARSPRSTRVRAHPHGPSSPPQSGHASSPRQAGSRPRQHLPLP